jgi:glutamate--cysteine ligase
MQDVANELLAIAMKGLERQRALNSRGDDETIYLEGMADMIRSGHTQASLTIARWKGAWNYDIDRLIGDLSYDAAVAS